MWSRIYDPGAFRDRMAHPSPLAQLIFRGGTCLHKLHLASPRRCSEDFDFVRTASSGIATFTPVELVSTKIRALFQRKKGRDLCDLWLALTGFSLDPSFRSDITPPIDSCGSDYDIDIAGQLVTDLLLSRIPPHDPARIGQPGRTSLPIHPARSIKHEPKPVAPIP